MLSSHLHCMMRNKQAFGNNCWVASAILNCQNLHFMLRDFNCHVILLHHVKFHCRVIVKTHFQYGGRPPSTFINFHFVVTLLPRVRNCYFIPIFHRDMMFLMISKMAAVRDLEFSKFAVYVVWQPAPCYSASPSKISLQLDLRLLSYGEKTILLRDAYA